MLGWCVIAYNELNSHDLFALIANLKFEKYLIRCVEFKLGAVFWCTGVGIYTPGIIVHMTWVCSGYNAHFDWLILGYFSPVMPKGSIT